MSNKPEERTGLLEWVFYGPIALVLWPFWLLYDAVKTSTKDDADK